VIKGVGRVDAGLPRNRAGLCAHVPTGMVRACRPTRSPPTPPMPLAAALAPTSGR